MWQFILLYYTYIFIHCYSIIVSVIPPPDRTRTTSISDTYVVVEWTATTRNDILYYVIKIVDKSGNTEKNEKTAGITNRFKVQNLLPGTTYFYQIKAVGSYSHESFWSAQVPVTTKTGKTAVS